MEPYLITPESLAVLGGTDPQGISGRNCDRRSDRNRDGRSRT